MDTGLFSFHYSDMPGNQTVDQPPLPKFNNVLKV